MKIMVAYDGSTVTKKALDYAKNQVRLSGGEIHVVMSMPRRVEVNIADINRMKELEHELKELKEQLTAEGYSCTSSLLTNDITNGENLVQYASENGIDNVVIGLKKTSKVGKMIFGSTAQYVILRAPCPVTSLKLS